MRIHILLLVLGGFISFSAIAQPKITVKHQRNAQNLAEVKVINETTKTLLCYVAIDGFKINFRLPPHGQSKWYKATDPRFDHKSFSVKCTFDKR